MRKALWIWLIMTMIGTGAVFANRVLTLEERMEAQRAIERVYYNHRIWPKENPQPKPPFEKMVPEEVIRKRVDNYLKKSILLDEYWQRPLIGQQLQAEMNRMVQNTKDPEMLRELFAALNNDPFLIAECFARPALADRLIRNWYAFDERFHNDSKQEILNLQKKAKFEGNEIRESKNFLLINISSDDGREDLSQKSFDLPFDDERFAKEVQRFPQPGQVSEIEANESFYFFRITFTMTDTCLTGAVIYVPKNYFDNWLSTKVPDSTLHIESINYNFNLPDDKFPGIRAYTPTKPDSWMQTFLPLTGRYNHTAVWTGSEMIIWGGYPSMNTGGRYDPTTDTWGSVPLTDAPEPRYLHTAVWTGTEMIVWGGQQSGYLNTGGRYNPYTDSWVATTLNSSPGARRFHTAIWTGSEMIIWGGQETSGRVNTGGRYNPHYDSWQETSLNDAPLARYGHTAVWSESEMIIWGGNGGLNTGGRYNPSLNSWEATSTVGAPSGREYHTAVWAEDRMIIWGGNTSNTGGQYDPVINAWTATTLDGAPSGRSYHSAVWTGLEMIIWGGMGSSPSYKNDGGRYDPETDSWILTTTVNAPVGRYQHSAVWTGSEMIVWGGHQSSTGYNTGGRYNPSLDSWVSTSYFQPEGRAFHTAVWTGTDMIIFGGFTESNHNIPSYKGYRYNPVCDQWTEISSINGPEARSFHSAVWTGFEMVIWGGGTGFNGQIETNTGAMYDPSLDSWTTTTTDNAPSSRAGHTSLWTGAEMIVWGGGFNTGGKYTPEFDTWVPTTIDGAPAQRSDNTGIWTGLEMIIWGGYDNTGGRYNPFDDSWVATSQVDSPTGRGNHSALWTGSHMLIWGGRTGSTELASGGLYNTQTDSWSEISSVNEPSPRWRQTAVWTGNEMIVWGGKDDYGQLDSGGRYDPFLNSWKTVTTLNAPVAREDHTSIWTGDRMIVWGGSDGIDYLNSGGIFFPDTEPRVIFNLSTSFNNDTVLELGSGEMTIFDGTDSSDGSNPYTTTPYHDALDRLTFSWDLNNDADFENECESASSGFDKTDSTFSLSQEELNIYGINAAGDYPIWLRVEDANGTRKCSSATLTVIDGQPPDVEVLVPNGEENWLYSASDGEREHYTIAWMAEDPYGVVERLKISYSTDGGSTWSCVADSAGIDCLSENLDGSDTLSALDNSFTWTIPTKLEAISQGQNVPSDLSFIKVEAWDSGNNRAEDSSDAQFSIIQPLLTTVKTLIVQDTERIERVYGTSARISLGKSLTELAKHTLVDGVILDLSSIQAIQDAYTCWDDCYDGDGCQFNSPCESASGNPQERANALAAEIRGYVLDQIQTHYNNVEAIILVGDDNQVPFYRMEDGTIIYSEPNYITEGGLSITTPVGSALHNGYFLTDNFYTELNPEISPIAGSDNPYVFMNDISLGRLVETPEQMTGVITNFLNRNGQITLVYSTDYAMVTGLEFLHDSALVIRNRFQAAGKNTDFLIDNPGQGGDSYTPADLGTMLFSTPPHNLININTHANHYSYAASVPVGASDVLLCTDATYNPSLCYSQDMDAYSGTLTGSALYTSGCHSGLVISNEGPDLRWLDLPEMMAEKGVVSYVGNTGYGWGLKDGRGLTEKLMIEISDQILEAGDIAMGQAVSQAKRRYYLNEKRYDVFDEKVLHELSLFGIPNYHILTAIDRVSDEGLPPADGPDRGCWEGICVEKSRETGTGLTLIPPDVTELVLNFTFGSGTYQQVTATDGSGSYYELNGQASGEVGDAIQPHFVYNSYLSGTRAHGILFTGGDYTTEAGFDPVVAVPHTLNYAPVDEGPLPSRSTWTPSVRASFGIAGVIGKRSIGEQGYTNMVVHTGSYDGGTGDESRFSAMQFAIYYSNDSDYLAPTITEPGAGGFHTLNGLTASFSVEAQDASGIYRVVVTYDDGAGSWTSLDLDYNDATLVWEGDLSVRQDIRYYVQVVDKQGNVKILTESGDDVDYGDVPYGSTWTGPRMWTIHLVDNENGDGTGDGLPDVWEDQYACVSSLVNDAAEDPDEDLLTHLEEFTYDTNPCYGDTDGGGENDGSEVRANGTSPKRNPKMGTDDHHLEIRMTESGGYPVVEWPDGTGAAGDCIWESNVGENDTIDGTYWVYRSDDPYFDDTELLVGSLPDGTHCHKDTTAGAGPYYYKVWNYEINTKAPIVGGLVPNHGEVLTQTAVSIYGEYYMSGATVTICGEETTNVIVEHQGKIKCVTPAHDTAEACDVTVTNPNGQHGTLTGGYTYTP